MLWARHLYALGYMVTLGLTKSIDEKMLIRCGTWTDLMLLIKYGGALLYAWSQCYNGGFDIF